MTWHVAGCSTPAGPDDVPDSGVAPSFTADIIVAASVVIGWSIICPLAQQ